MYGYTPEGHFLNNNAFSDFNEILSFGNKFPYKRFEIKITIKNYLCACMIEQTRLWLNKLDNRQYNANKKRL